MTRQAEIAVSLAHVVLLLRDHPEDRDGQKIAFRALLTRLADGSLWVGANDSHFLVDGEPVATDTPDLKALRDQLLGHGVGELKVPGETTPANVLVVVRALSSLHGTFPRLHQFADYFRDHGIAIQLAPPVPAVLPRSSPAPAQTPPTIRPGFMPPPMRPPDKAKQDEGGISALGPGAANEESVGLLHFVTLEQRSIGHLDELLMSLAQKPGDAHASEWLNELVAYTDLAAQKAQWSDILQAANVLVQLEGTAADDDSRRGFHIALRRMVSSYGVLDQLARMTAAADTRAAAVAVLRRMGADATETLMKGLIAATDLGERRGYFNALSQMTEGTELMVHMLGHDEWFVVRNVAELVGEMKLEPAVPALIKQSRNSEERVRRAVVAALAKIGTPQTIDSLRQALSDPAPAVRMQVIGNLEGAKVKNLVPALVKLVEEDDQPDLRHEALRALGRIGTQDAVEVLKEASQPSKGLFKRKPSGLRLAAVEGLRLAGGAAAKRALEALAEDKDADFRAAAERALKHMADPRE